MSQHAKLNTEHRVARSKWLNRSRLKLAFRTLTVALAVYLSAAYFILPLAWLALEHHRHPGLVAAPKVTVNAEGIPGDPLNVGLIGDRDDVVRALLKAGWQPADPITFTTSLKIAESVLLHRPDPNAPVSSLYVFGRKQDMAFEQEVGDSASRRHHVRFWQARELDHDGRPLWLGSATFDVKSGISHLTGQITHHIDRHIDAERDHLLASLRDSGALQSEFQLVGVGPTQAGRNAGGDLYVTDGRLLVGVLTKRETATKTSDAQNVVGQRMKSHAVRVQKATHFDARNQGVRPGSGKLSAELVSG